MFIKKIISLIKKIFNKQEEIKILESPKQQIEKNNFIESLKINVNAKSKDKKVQTLICFGDGLGIQKKITS